MTSPNPSWKPGDKINSPVKEMVTIDPSKSRVVDVYKLLIGSIIPRPIAFVSSVSNEGVGNLAPFSFFNGVSSNPPCIMISITRKRTGEKKDTLKNIEETGGFVVNSANAWLVEAIVHCGAEYPYGVDEMKKIGLTPLPSIKVRAPRVKESAIQMECELYKTMEIGEAAPGSTTLVIGKVILIHVATEAYQDGKVLHGKIRPIGRLGGISYTEVVNSFEIPIPDLNNVS